MRLLAALLACAVGAAAQDRPSNDLDPYETHPRVLRIMEKTLLLAGPRAWPAPLVFSGSDGAGRRCEVALVEGPQDERDLTFTITVTGNALPRYGGAAVLRPRPPAMTVSKEDQQLMLPLAVNIGRNNSWIGLREWSEYGRRDTEIFFFQGVFADIRQTGSIWPHYGAPKAVNYAVECLGLKLR